MIRNVLIILMLSVFFISCNESMQEVILYQNTGEIDRTYDVTEDTFWDFKNDGDIDSLKIDNKVGFNNFYGKISKKSFKNKPFLNPEYAIIIKTSKSIDTIYINDKLNKGYSTNEAIMFDANGGVFLSYFEEKQFLTRHSKSLLNK